MLPSSQFHRFFLIIRVYLQVLNIAMFLWHLFTRVSPAIVYVALHSFYYSPSFHYGFDWLFEFELAILNWPWTCLLTSSASFCCSHCDCVLFRVTLHFTHYLNQHHHFHPRPRYHQDSCLLILCIGLSRNYTDLHENQMNIQIVLKSMDLLLPSSNLARLNFSPISKDQRYHPWIASAWPTSSSF